MKNYIKYNIGLIFCICLISCNSNYNHIQEYFPDNTIKTSKFLRTYPNDTVKPDTVVFYESIKRLGDEIDYKLHIDYKIDNDFFIISITPRYVTVSVDSSRWMNNLYSQKYIRRTKDILTMPEHHNIDGWYKEFNDDNSVRLSIPWPHPYEIYFSFDNNELIIHKYTTFKIGLYSSYYFSKQKGLYKMVSYGEDFVTNFMKINNAP